jgi:K(+)-stimulated pyrophosphate-energized sodium pump
MILAAPIAALLALAFAAFKAKQTMAASPGDAEMVEIAGRIEEGAMAFLKREYTVLSGFVVIVAIILGVLNSSGEMQSPYIALSFVVGASLSALAGYFGMVVATKANVRTTEAAKKGLGPALAVAFGGGTVMGMCVVGLGLLGLGSLFILFTNMGATLFGGDEMYQLGTAINVLTGFSMGASSIALFARVGGGIYTKAADVGADLVGKVEAGLPEDILVTLQLSLTTLVTTLVMSLVWAPTCSNRMWAPSLAPWFSDMVSSQLAAVLPWWAWAQSFFHCSSLL